MTTAPANGTVGRWWVHTNRVAGQHARRLETRQSGPQPTTQDQHDHHKRTGGGHQARGLQRERDTHSLDQTSLPLCGKAFYTLSDRPITGQVVTANCVVRHFTRLATAEAQGAGTSHDSKEWTSPPRGTGLRSPSLAHSRAHAASRQTNEERRPLKRENKTMDCT